mgnify:CR=1 FL=1
MKKYTLLLILLIISNCSYHYLEHSEEQNIKASYRYEGHKVILANLKIPFKCYSRNIYKKPDCVAKPFVKNAIKRNLDEYNLRISSNPESLITIIERSGTDTVLLNILGIFTLGIIPIKAKTDYIVAISSKNDLKTINNQPDKVSVFGEIGDNIVNHSSIVHKNSIITYTGLFIIPFANQKIERDEVLDNQIKKAINQAIKEDKLILSE